MARYCAPARAKVKFPALLLSDGRGRSRYEAGTGTHASGQLATFG